MLVSLMSFNTALFNKDENALNGESMKGNATLEVIPNNTFTNI